MNYRSILKDHVWSFSSLHLYEQCPYAFYCRYIEGREGEGNYYAENGTAVHQVIAGLLTGEYSLEEAPSSYMEKYNEIYSMTRESTMERTFNSCLDYFCEADPIPDKYKVLMVEQRMDFRVGHNKFVGYADAVLKNRHTGEIVLLDHKSSNHFLKKDGTPLKNSASNFYAYRHQAYLYCKGLKDIYGLQVNTIYLHHFKDKGILSIIPFNEADYEETLQWATDLIKKIKADSKFQNVDNYMMCNQICEYRHDCEYLMKEEDF